jgi:chloramphenicol O-acetyltransferase type A
MMQKIDLHTWYRRDHFDFFRRFEEPFFGVTVRIDCTAAYQRAKEEQTSFFLRYLHHSLRAANLTEPFRYRISEEDDLLLYDRVHASPTINRPDGSFGFGYMDYHPDPAVFIETARLEMDKVRAATGLIPAVVGQNVVQYSAMPWLDFTSVQHARAFSFKDSCPKISFGKMTEQEGRLGMPVSIHVHHALMDGFHVGQYVELFQELMNG